MRTITTADVYGLLKDLERTYPGFCLRTKTSASERCTTWNRAVYVPQDWGSFSSARQWIRLTHEAQHLRQFTDLGTWRFAAKYAWPSGRFALEQPAYAAEFQTYADIYGIEALLARKAFYIEQFSGRSYYWMASEPTATAWVNAAMAAVLTPPPA